MELNYPATATATVNGPYTHVRAHTLSKPSLPVSLLPLASALVLQRSTQTRQLTRTLPPLPAEHLQHAGLSILRLLNHPHLLALRDIVHTTSIPGEHASQSYTVHEATNAGTLADLLPSTTPAPSPHANVPPHGLSHASEFGSPPQTPFVPLPEALCWNVLLALSSALLWLHYGVKAVDPGNLAPHDDDWQPVLIRDLSPKNVFFMQPEVDSWKPYGACKLGGFGKAKVVGTAKGRRAICEAWEGAGVWSPPVGLSGARSTINEMN